MLTASCASLSLQQPALLAEEMRQLVMNTVPSAGPGSNIFPVNVLALYTELFSGLDRHLCLFWSVLIPKMASWTLERQ